MLGNDGGDTGDQFRNPNGIAVDGAGNIYVADTNNYRIQEFTPTPAKCNLQANMAATPGPMVKSGADLYLSTGNRLVCTLWPPQTIPPS